jgi:hypothetical protein
MKSNTLSLVTPQTSIVPINPREAVRNLFNLDNPMTIADVISQPEFIDLQEKFDLEAEGEILEPIDLSVYIQKPSSFDLRLAWIDYVDQRERLKDNKYTNEIIRMALNFKVKHAGIPTLSVPTDAPEEDQYRYLLDWQKRTLALALRGVYVYPCNIVETTTNEMSKDFSSQFKLKDRMEEYDKFKASLAEGSEKHWAMQDCFTRMGVSAYPFSAPPQITALGNVTKAMFDSTLNPKEKNTAYNERTFTNFVRAVNIYRSVWPVSSKQIIQGSFVRGLTAILASFDPQILKGTDTWVIQILEEAKNPKYNIYNIDGDPVGLAEPSDWTKNGWDGNMFHQVAISSFANAWNEIAKNNKLIPKLDKSPIIALNTSGVKMLDMKLA